MDVALAVAALLGARVPTDDAVRSATPAGRAVGPGAALHEVVVLRRARVHGGGLVQPWQHRERPADGAARLDEPVGGVPSAVLHHGPEEGRGPADPVGPAEPAREILLRAVGVRGHAGADRADVLQEPVAGEPGPRVGHESEQSQVVVARERRVEDDPELLLEDGPQESPAGVGVVRHNGADVGPVSAHLRGGDEADALPLAAEAAPRRGQLDVRPEAPEQALRRRLGDARVEGGHDEVLEVSDSSAEVGLREARRRPHCSSSSRSCWTALSVGPPSLRGAL